MSEILGETQRDEMCASGWEIIRDGRALSKQYRFRNFVDAFGFMTKCAIWAEKINHHPEWHNVYDHVDVVLTTHDTNGLTALDARLGKKMDELAENYERIADE